MLHASIRQIVHNSQAVHVQTLEQAALDPVTEQQTVPIGPYGFGYLKIPKSVINESLMSGNKLRIRLEHGANVSFWNLSSFNGKNSFSFVQILENSATHKVLQFNVTGGAI